MTTSFDSRLLERSSKRTITLVSFLWSSFDIIQGSEGEFYSDSEEDRPFFGRDFVGQPKMEIDLPEITGTLAQEKAIITLPFEQESFLDYATDGLPFARTLVRVDEVVLPVGRSQEGSQPSQQRIGLFCGYMSKGMRNPRGRRGLARIEALSPKSLLEGIELGIPATDECGHVFGGAGCYLKLSTSNTLPSTGPGPLVLDDVVLSSVDGTGVQFIQSSGAGHLAGKNATYWDEGFWQYKGLRFKIRSWQAGSNNFVLFDQPRDDLIGKEGTLVPGCDKSLTSCRFWKREQFFGAYGWGIPAHNPLFEIPDPEV